MSQIDDFLNDGPQPQGGSQTARKPDAVAKPKSQVDAFLADAPAPDRGLGGFARDAAAWAVKGAIAVPEAIVGLADIPTGGRVGKALENEGGTFGFRPKQAREIVNEWHSDATKEAQRKFQEAEGLGGKFQAAIENPSNIAGAVIESLPAMGAGGVIGRGALAATRLGQMGSKGAVVAGALGEGAVMAGSQAEGIRQETDDGLLTPGQAGAALATGAIGAGLGYAGGKLANKLGVGNAETMLAQGTKGLAKQHADEAVAAAANPLMVQAAKGIPRQVIEGALVEGVFEELPQSVTETIIQNLALDKPWSEGLDEAIVLGVLSGGAMGAGAAGYKGFTAPKADENKSNEAKQAADKAKQEQEARKADALQRVQQAWQQQAQLLAEQEAGEPEVPQTAPPDAAAMLAQQRAQEAQARQAEIDAGRAMASPDDEIYESTGTTMRPSEAMGLNPTAGGIEGAAALAVDTGASAAMQAAAQYIDPDDMPDAGADAPLSAASAVADTAPEDPFAGYERDYDELSDLEKELYDWEMTQREAPDEAFAALAELDDSDIPFFDRASNATDEDFLRALGASDEEIADALTTANQSASTQSHAASTAETQTNEPRSPRQSAGQGQEAKQVSQQLLPTDPAARIAELEAIAKDADAQARDWASRTYKHNPKPLPEHEAKGGPADVGEANEQRRLKAIADAKQRAAEARAEITRLQEQGNTQAQLAAKAPSVADLAAISRKQIPDMTDAELVALASATSPEHGRFKKLQKALQSRGLQAQAATNKGATENGTQASQTQQAGTQQQQAGAAVGQAIDSVPAGAAAQAAGQSTVTATQKTGNDGAQAAAQGEAVAKAIAQEGNARREAERQRKLEASERWTRMTAAERQAAAANAKGLNAIQKKNVHTKPWADLSDKVRAALLDVVVPQDAAQKVAQNSGQQTDSKEKEAKNDEKAVTELIEAGFDEVADWAQQELAHQEPVKENEIEVAASEAATHPDSNAPEPTQAQKEAGNYKKGHVRINGHDISIENPAGTSRRPEWPALKNHYGYFKGSVGADKDHVDVFLTDRADDASLPVFVVDQNNQDGSFDEHKVIMGAATEAEARQTYLQNYEKGWTGLGAITQMTQDEFKSWVYDPSKTKKPAAQKVRAAGQYGQDVAEPAAEAATDVEKQRAIERHGLPDGTTFSSGKGMASGKWIARAGDTQGNMEATIDEAASSLAQFLQLEKRRKENTAAMVALSKKVADKLKRGEQPTDVELRDLFGLDPRHAYVKQSAVGQFLVDYMGVSRNKIRASLGAAAGDVTSDGGVKYPVVYPRKLHQVFGTTEAADEAQAGDKQADRFAGNKIFTADKVAAARERLRKKLGQLNSGIDPELLVDGMTIAGAYIESGIRSFNQFAKAMVQDMGDGVKPYLLSFWEGARNYPGLDTKGMTSPEESAREFAELNKDVIAAAKDGDHAALGENAEAIGAVAPKPAKRTRKTGQKRDMTLTQDWGVEHIDGYGDSSREVGNSTKDAFLKEAKAYLNAVTEVLQEAGFAPHLDHKGNPSKPVSVNESGPAVSGEVSLTMRHADTGTNVYVHVGDTALRGVMPTTPSGIAVMARVSTTAGDKYANKGTNHWMQVDLSAADLAAELLRAARAKMEAQSRTNDLKDQNNEHPEQAGSAANQGRTPEVSGGRGNAAQSGAAQADSADVAAKQSQDGSASADTGRTGGAGLRVPAADVAGAQAADKGGDASDRRTRTSGARTSDAGARSAGSVKKPETVSPANTGPGNFHIDNPLEIVGGGQVARFDKNKAAIELLNTIREAGRTATTEEQRILAGYTGWGSFGQELFQGTWAKPMPKQGWEERDRWLRDHLGQDEWESAQRSITNAHYTDPPTVMAMWDMAKRMGFTGGRVLEPSMGIGNFFGMMPLELKNRSQLAGIELDELTGSMAKLLYPDANIKVMGYQESKTPDNFYDLVIGNWPFENTVIADRRYNRLSPFLHDYFFLKALDQVRPGGLVIGITSNGSMDKRATNIRAALARKAELVSAIRLPSGAFQEYAGTKVVTDIVILKKREQPLSATPDDGWLRSVPYKTPSGPEVFINEYFVNNPDNIIGTTDWGHGTTRVQPGMIVHRPENMAQRLREAVALVPEGVMSKANHTKHISYVTNHTADREGSLTEQDGKLFVVRGEHLAPAQEVVKYAVKDAKKTAAREKQLRDLIAMRRLYAQLIEAEHAGDAEKQRTALRTAFEAFEKEHGVLGDSWGLEYLSRIDDPFYPALAALSVNGKPSAILSASTMRGAVKLTNPTPQDAYVLARNKSVSPTLKEIAQLAGKPEAEVKRALIESGAVFESPAGDIVPSDIYLSGNVRHKLREAQAALAEGNQAMGRNVAELKKVVPADIPYFNIESQLGATWVPAKVYADYIAYMLNRPNSNDIEVSFTNGRWKARLPAGANHSTEARTGFGTEHYKFSKLVNAALTNQTVKIKRKDSNGHEYVDFEATAEANARIGEIRSKFAEWLWSDPERRADLEAEYNETRNAYATPKFDGSFLSFEGMALQLGNSPFNLRKHQANAIWRALVNKRSINAHEVGTGKTFTMGGIAVESRRYGIAKKPLILAHNANSASVAHEIQMMYPAAKVLYVDNLSPATIAVKMRQIANDDWDAVVFPHSLIDRLSFREETLMEMAKEDIRSLEEEAYAAADEDGVKLDAKMLDDEEELKKLRSVTAKELVKARNRIIETIKKQAMRSSREGAVPFEELGIDMALVDEVHEFKKPPISTRMQMKGLNTQTSDRSIALQFITRYVRANNFGGNVHTFTGTPITNTMTEIFHQMRYVMEDEMKEAGVDTWDGWFGSFSKEVQDVELSAAGEYEPVTRLASFINVPELRRMIGQYLDVVFASDMPEMQPRKVNGKTLTDPDLTEAERAELLNGRTEGAKDRPYKKVINVISDLTPQQKKIFAQIQGYARAWREMTGKQRKEAMAKGAPESPIITEGMANKASFDVRLVNDEALAGMEGKAPDDPGSKVSKVIENVLEIYHSDHRTAQVIFSDVGYSTSQKRSVGRNEAGEKAYKTVKTFSTMRDLVERLVQSGIPREQIAIVDGSTSKEKRKEIADAVNELRIRVVIGSTDTLGVGVNMQKNLRAMHHMDAPYMPGELEQRNGRGLRQGNQWNTVLEYRYMSDRLDGRRWQILAIKQRFITAFMKASGDTRVIEGDAVNDGENDILQSFSEAAGDPRILIREKLRKNVETLQRAERMHTNGVADARRSLRGIRENIEWSRGQLNQMLADNLPERLRNLMKQQSEDFRMVVRGVTYDSRADAEDAILKFFKEEMRMEHSGVPVGNYGELQVTARWPSLMSMPELVIEVQGQEFSGSLRGIEQQIRNFPHRIQKLEEGIAQREASIERLEQVAAAPFARAKDLDGAIKRLQDLERDIEQNPVPPPAWLRSGAPVDSEAYRNGQPFVVTGHRWTKEGWFVLGQDAKGNMAVPYTEVTDAQGMALYEEREFQAPEIVDKSAKSAEGVGTDEAGEVRAAAPQDDANFEGAAKRRPGTAQDKAVMQALADGKSARDVLRLIANQSKDPFRRQVARLLLKAGITPNIQFGHIGKDKKGNPIHGQYRGKSDTILIAGSAEYAAERIFLHEAMHAATMRALAKPGLASQRLRALLAHVQKQPGAQGFYGTKNVDEFVAEVFTNPDFQRALRTMRAPSGSALKSAWDGFVRILRSILGLPRDADNVLSHALKLGVEAVRADMVLRRQGARAAGSVNAGADTIDQTQTEAFKRWFGDGGVRNADGEPQVFYHGGASDFTGIRFGGRFDGAIFVREGAESGYGEKQHALYLNSPILELDEMRDLLADNPQVLANVLGGNVAPDVLDMVAESLTDGSNYPDSKEVWDAIGAIDEADAQLETQKLRGRVARALGFKAVRTPDEFGGETVMVLDASAVKSAIGNNGNFDPEDPSILNFGTDDLGRIKASALDQIHKTLSHPGKVSLWDKTVGTMRHIAERYPAFKPVFDAAQQFLDDVASVANEAADMAPRLIPRVDTMRDMLKKPISVADNRAIGKALFSGTLDWGRDQHGKAMPMNELRAKYANLSVDTKSEILMASGKVQPQVIAMWRGKELAQYETLINNKFESTILKSGVRFSHEELRKFFNLNEQQISLYDEARATVDKSLDLTARAEMLRKLGRDWDFMRDMVMDAPTLTEAWKLLHEELEQRAKEIPDSRDQMAAKMFEIRSSFDKAQELMEHGYMPLQRFGKYTVDVVDENGERVYFSMFESKAESNKMAQAMRREYPNARVVQGTMNDQQFKLFAGITPETAELFGSMLGLDADGQDAKDQAFQEYLKLAKNNHSALKRLIHRKGIAGYSEDVGRVLASFVYSNARLAATGLNAGKMEQAINTLQTEHKEQGELGEIAAKLRSYIQDPQEEGHVIRGMLFAQYLGGSVASAAVNMTQPFAVTLPWLTQYGGMAAAGRYLAGALRDMAKRGHKYEADLAHALKMAEDDGVVSPQEIHQLMAQARGAGGLRTGDGTKLGDARAQAANLWEKVKVGWGQPFALAEQFNRRSTFIAAYRLAKNRKLGNPAEFARRAVLETQFLYSKANKPQWARGAVGGTLFTFKTYSVSFLELMHRMWTQGGPEGKRAVGWAMAMLLLMGGAGGLPFMEDLEDLIDGAGQMMGYNVSAKQWRQQLLRDVLGAELAGFIEQGMSGLPGAPVDVSGRLGMGNLIPGTGLLLDKQSNARDVVELLGPAGDLVQRGMQAVKSVASGVVNADPTSIGRGVMEVMPTAVRNAAKGVDMASSGIYKDTKGYKVIDTTLDEAVAKFLGFQPRSVAEVQEANSFMQRAKSFYIQTSNEIKAQWAKALFEKDAAGVERARQRVKEWNEKNPDQPIRVNMRAIWERVRQMGKDRTARIADTAPKALRQQLRDMAQEQSR